MLSQCVVEVVHVLADGFHSVFLQGFRDCPGGSQQISLLIVVEFVVVDFPLLVGSASDEQGF